MKYTVENGGADDMYVKYLYARQCSTRQRFIVHVGQVNHWLINPYNMHIGMLKYKNVLRTLYKYYWA